MNDPKMKILIGAACVAVFATAAWSAEDYSGIPVAIRTKIKVECIAKYPGDYAMQHGCIIIQSESYLAVEGYAPQRVELKPFMTACNETEANEASAFLKSAPDFYSAEYAVTLRACIEHTPRSTALGKRFRALAAENNKRTPRE